MPRRKPVLISLQPRFHRRLETLPSYRVFLSNPILDPAASQGEWSPRRAKMAYLFEWIPKFGNHPEKEAGREYTPLPGYFTRGRRPGTPISRLAGLKLPGVAWMSARRKPANREIGVPGALSGSLDCRQTRR